MPFSRPGFQAVIALLVWSLGEIAALADDSVFVSEQDRFSIGVPDGSWARLNSKTGALKWIAAKKGASKIASVTVAEAIDGVNFGRSEFQNAFDTGYLKPMDGTKIKGAGIVLEGRLAYRLVASCTIAGRKGSRVTEVVASHSRPYVVSVVSFVSDADSDPEIASILKSFRLLDPPEPLELLPAPTNQNDSERMGEIAGTVVIGVLVVFYVLKKFVG